MRASAGKARHQFVIHADSCSGIPGAPHEDAFASVNAVVRRLSPQPDFIVFLGDEVAGLVQDGDALRAQWHHWLHTEMGWLDRRELPMWRTTGNHTTYERRHLSRGVLPGNGPPGLR